MTVSSMALSYTYNERNTSCGAAESSFQLRNSVYDCMKSSQRGWTCDKKVVSVTVGLNEGAPKHIPAENPLRVCAETLGGMSCFLVWS